MVETRLAKRRRLDPAQQALERNIATFVSLGVPPGVVRKVLQMARLLRRVLPLPMDMADQVALHWLYEIRSPIRYLWSWMRPAPIQKSLGFRFFYDPDTSAILPGGRQMAWRYLLVQGRWLSNNGKFATYTDWWRRNISTATFNVESTPSGPVVMTEPWTAVNNWQVGHDQLGENPFFPPDNRPRRQFRYQLWL